MKMHLLGVSLALVLVAGCANQGQESLYSSLGGMDGIHHIVGRFIAEVGDSKEIKPFFLNTNLDRFYRMFSEHLCAVAGGPCKYTGDTMHDVHAGMHINEAEFNTVVDLLTRSMDAEGIPTPVQNRLLARLAPMRKQIIYQ